MPIDWPELITVLGSELDELLARIPDDGWQQPAAYVGWSCWRTAEHISGDFAHYASQVATGAADHYVAFSWDTTRAKTPAELREVLRAAGGFLSACVRVAAPDSLAWHPHGTYTPAGYAAIGAAEGIVHSTDIAAGLGLPWMPSDTVVAPVLDMVFPGTRRPEEPPLPALLRATGRGPDPTPGRWTYSAAATRL
jgi:hypothetical protein